MTEIAAQMMKDLQLVSLIAGELRRRHGMAKMTFISPFIVEFCIIGSMYWYGQSTLI